MNSDADDRDLRLTGSFPRRSPGPSGAPREDQGDPGLSLGGWIGRDPTPGTRRDRHFSGEPRELHPLLRIEEPRNDVRSG